MQQQSPCIDRLVFTLEKFNILLVLYQYESLIIDKYYY